MISIVVNGRRHEIDAPPEMPLLWVLRDILGLTGTKFGCGIAECGACMVQVDGAATHSCVTPLSEVAGRNITTIEGVGEDGDHPVQAAWIRENVSQCGYCQPGQIISAISLLETNPQPDEDEVASAMSGNLCRCGTYNRIRKAIRTAIVLMEEKSDVRRE